ncbi:MAG: nucleoside 2-deoxyribosyltransferase domain-containing protein [Novosphingobium sp.]|nr:nucleoside 2-deoxyribosyltransferase domain-containing protein [Novosphingobium sp.]
MKPLLVLAALIGAVSVPAAAMADAVVVTSPEALPARHDRPRVFLGGSIDMGSAPDWQKQVIAALQGENVVLLNPRRPDWSPAWKPEASEPEFRRQVEWELAALDSADVVILYLAPGSQSPVSLLELGLHARSGKVVLLCPPGFWRKGNVDITGERYGVKQVQSLDELIAETRKRVNDARQVIETRK